MTVRYIFTFLFYVGFATLCFSQTGIKGSIKTQKGEALPFAAISVKGSAIGTISNAEGNYQLDLKPGYYEIVFQYLGYKSGIKPITIENRMETYNLTMEEQALNLGEARIGAKDENPAYTIMRKAIAKSRYHFLQVASYTAKAYTKSSFVVTDLPMEFLYKKELKEAEKESNFKKGVPILNETVSEVTFRQPNNYKQKVVASRNSQDKNLGDVNAYLLTSFYQPEVVKAVSPLSPRAFAYYKFEYEGSFRENGVEINKIKVIPRSYGEGVYRGTIFIAENLWSIYSLDLHTVNTGFNIDIKQVYAPIQGVWMPINQQFHVAGGIYGFKGNGDFVISQTFSSLKLNPALQADIAVVDGKREQEEAKKIGLKNREIKTQKMDELVNKQKEFSAKNLRKLMKEYEKQDLKAKEEKGEDVDLAFTRNDSTQVDSMANKRSTAFWDSIRSVPLTKAEVKSYIRLDSIIIVNEGSLEQRDSLKTSKADTTKKEHKGGSLFGDIFTGHTFRFGKKSPFRLDYVSPLFGLQVNTVEGLVLNGGGLKLRYKQGSGGDKEMKVMQIGSEGVKAYSVGKQSELSFSVLTRYSFARNKLMVYGGADYAWKRSVFRLTGGQGVSQFNSENPLSPLLNTISTLFFEQNFIKIYEKDFVRLDFNTNRGNEHFELKANIELANRRPLQNVENVSRYHWIDWKARSFTSNRPAFQEEPKADWYHSPVFPLDGHQALTLGLTASYKPWQKYKTKSGKTSYYEDESPKLTFNYRKGIDKVFNSDVNFDFIQVGIMHGFNTGVRSKLRYKFAAGAFLNNKSVRFADYQHFAGNQFFFQLGDPVGTFRMLDYYRFSTAQRFAEAHVLSEFRKFLLTQIAWFRILGIKENFFAHYLATPHSQNYTELGYGLDVGIRFPFRIEVANSFENAKYKHTVFRIGTTMNFSFGK